MGREHTPVNRNYDTRVTGQVCRHVNVHAYIGRVVTEIGDLGEGSSAGSDGMGADEGVEEIGEEESETHHGWGVR